MKPSLSRKAGKSHNPRPVSRSHPRPNPKQPYGCIMTGYKKHAVTCVACSTPVRHFDRIGLGRVARQALQPRSQAGDREMKEAGSGVASTGASAEGQHPAKLFHESGFSQACSGMCIFMCVHVRMCVHMYTLSTSTEPVYSVRYCRLTMIKSSQRAAGVGKYICSVLPARKESDTFPARRGRQEFFPGRTFLSG